MEFQVEVTEPHSKKLKTTSQPAIARLESGNYKNVSLKLFPLIPVPGCAS